MAPKTSAHYEHEEEQAASSLIKACCQKLSWSTAVTKGFSKSRHSNKQSSFANCKIKIDSFSVTLVSEDTLLWGQMDP